MRKGLLKQVKVFLKSAKKGLQSYGGGTKRKPKHSRRRHR